MYVSREYSYHGATLGAMSVSISTNIKVIKFLPKNNIIIPEHNFLKNVINQLNDVIVQNCTKMKI